MAMSGRSQTEREGLGGKKGGGFQGKTFSSQWCARECVSRSAGRTARPTQPPRLSCQGCHVLLPRAKSIEPAIGLDPLAASPTPSPTSTFNASIPYLRLPAPPPSPAVFPGTSRARLCHLPAPSHHGERAPFSRRVGGAGNKETACLEPAERDDEIWEMGKKGETGKPTLPPRFSPFLTIAISMTADSFLACSISDKKEALPTRWNRLRVRRRRWGRKGNGCSCCSQSLRRCARPGT